jgi:hypothetical protein
LFELGWHSLTARVRYRLRVSCDLVDIFPHPTVAAFARLVDDRVTSADDLVVIVTDGRDFDCADDRSRAADYSMHIGTQRAGSDTPAVFKVPG